MSGCALEPLPAPDLLGPVEAWRAWRVVRSGGRRMLGSVVKPRLWPHRQPLVARCLRPPSPFEWLSRRPRHDAPALRCECGIYGADVELAAYYLCEPGAACGHVIGTVSLWGTVVECEHGFRASRAYPLRLFVPADAGGRRGNAAEIAAELGGYGVEVELLPARARDMLAALVERQPA